MRQYRSENPDYVRRERQYGRKHHRNKREDTKKLVLSHYGKEGTSKCCWDGCEIDDVDMLSIDHVHDNGKEHRKTGCGGGCELYRRLIRDGYPDGYQTLCLNHQMKKEILRKRKLRTYEAHDALSDAGSNPATSTNKIRRVCQGFDGRVKC